MAGVEVATAYVSLAPSARGFGAKVESEIGRELRSVSDRQGKQFGDRFSKQALEGFDRFGKKASAFITTPVAAAAVFSIKAASDLSESINKVDVVFGDAAKGIHEFSKSSAKDLGISRRGAEEAAGTFGNLFVSMGLAKPAAATMSSSLVKLAADLASFNNATPQEALDALRAGLIGETEPLRRFGVNLNDATLREKALSLGLTKTTKEVLPPAIKAQAAYALIFEQTTTAQGDFARTSQGMANQQRIVRAQLEDTAAAIGAKLLPAGLELVKMADAIVTGFTNLPEPLQNTALALVGIAAAAGPTALAFTKTIAAAKALAAAYEYLTIRAGALTVAAGGIGLALAGIGTLALAIGQVKAQFKEMAQAIDNDLGPAVNNLALFGNNERDVAVNAYMAAAGVKSMVQATKGGDFAKELAQQGKIAKEVLGDLADQSGVSRERIVQLANSMGINLAKATEEQRSSLASAIAEVGRAVTPTERLAVAQETLGNAAATSAEQFDAFKDALDAALGVQLTAEQASIKYQDRIAALTAAMADNGTQIGTATEKQRTLFAAFLDTVGAAEDEVQALVRSGRISSDAATQKQELINRLETLKKQFPTLTPKIDEYIAHINSIPETKPTQVSVNGVEKAIIDIDRLKSKMGQIPNGAFTYVDSVVGKGGYGGGRRVGGPVNPGNLYEVTEGGIPELLRQGNRTYLIPGSQGTVIPSTSASGMSSRPDGQPIVVEVKLDRAVLARAVIEERYAQNRARS